jgi:DNA-binding CsgD family transcriptional regulator
VHFYPVKDATGIVHLVATTFAEVSRRNSAELQLSRLKHKLHSALPRRTVIFDSEFSLWNARVLGLVESSIATLKSSTHVRHCSTMARMESGLGHLDFSLSFTQDGDADSKAPYDPSPAAIREVASLDPPPAPSPREREVLHHLAEGKSNKQIGSVLHLSTRTVETYRARLMLKLRIHSTAELVRYAIRHQITAV